MVKNYVFRLWQDGGSQQPEVTVKETSLSGPVAWERISPGVYKGTLAGEFDPANLWRGAPSFEPNFMGNEQRIVLSSNIDALFLFVTDSSNSPIDGCDVYAEVRIYVPE